MAAQPGGFDKAAPMRLAGFGGIFLRRQAREVSDSRRRRRAADYSTKLEIGG